MKSLLQNILLFLYRQAVNLGILNIPWFKKFMLRLYFVYKRHLEMRGIERLLPFVSAGSSVIDVGAAVGFFTVGIAKALSAPGKIYAIEPEPQNLNDLERTIVETNLSANVQIVHAVVCDKSGLGKIVPNLYHMTDHSYSQTEGIEVPAITIDDLMAREGWPQISLIKIDVQGSEGLVLAGALQTIERQRPVFVVEVDDLRLKKFNFSALQLLSFFTERNYRIHSLDNLDVEVSVEEAEIFSRNQGSADFVMVPEKN